MKTIIRTALCALIASALLSACSGAGVKNTNEITYQSDTVTIAQGSPILSKIVTQTVTTEPFSSEMRTVGTVRARTGHYAEVGVPFDGRVLTSKIRLGSRVKAGQSLFELSSPEFLEACKQYFQSIKNCEKAEADYNRKKALQSSGIISQRELEEAYTEAENARQDKQSAEATVRIYGADPATMTMGQPQSIVAPIAGEVVKSDITPGAYVKADSDPLLIIADLSRVWITAQVKERFIGSVSQGSSAEIFTEADSGNPVWGEIIYVGNLVDEQTRSVQVIVECDNPDTALKHGMYVSVHFMSKAKESILVPSTAVFQGDGSSYVFVATESDNTFIRRDVVAGVTNDDKTRVLIEDGLEKGETILAQGGLYLNN